jgi:hypothetical protein
VALKHLQACLDLLLLQLLRRLLLLLLLLLQHLQMNLQAAVISPSGPA